jgi:hypothetical protein
MPRRVQASAGRLRKKARVARRMARTRGANGALVGRGGDDGLFSSKLGNGVSSPRATRAPNEEPLGVAEVAEQPRRLHLSGA